MTQLEDWAITAYADREAQPHETREAEENLTLLLDIVHGEESDALEVASEIADSIEASDTLWTWYGSHYSAALVKRHKRSWRIRCDAFEGETDNGYDNGYGRIRIHRL